MDRNPEIKLLKDTADIGLGYAAQLIEWFGTAERAIEYLTADGPRKNRMLATVTASLPPAP